MEPPNIFSRVFNFFNGPCDFSQKTESNSKMVKANLAENTTNSYSAKTKKLQDSHRLSPKEESWFNLEPQQFIPEYPPSFYPPSDKPFHTFKPSSSHHQPIFNLNRGRFESLPVSVASQEYNPSMSMSQCQPYPSHQGEMFCLPQTMDQLVDMVEFTLVESVCHRSRLEYNHQNRLAAEILAASTLNPNAKEFTPKTNMEPALEQLDGHIELSHEDDDEMCHPSVATISRKDESEDKEERDNCSCDSTDNDTDDDDWDWDSDEDCATVECVDLAEFEDLFQVNLLVTNLQPKPAVTAVPKLCKRLQQVNSQFCKLYPGSLCDVKTGPCLVSFSDNPVIILEPESLAEELQEARKSDFKQRQADKERMERLLAPILTTQHRNNIYRKIYGESSL